MTHSTTRAVFLNLLWRKWGCSFFQFVLYIKLIDILLGFCFRKNITDRDKFIGIIDSLTTRWERRVFDMDSAHVNGPARWILSNEIRRCRVALLFVSLITRNSVLFPETVALSPPSVAENYDGLVSLENRGWRRGTANSSPDVFVCKKLIKCKCVAPTLNNQVRIIHKQIAFSSRTLTDLGNRGLRYDLTTGISSVWDIWDVGRLGVNPG